MKKQNCRGRKVLRKTPAGSKARRLNGSRMGKGALQKDKAGEQGSRESAYICDACKLSCDEGMNSGGSRHLSVSIIRVPYR